MIVVDPWSVDENFEHLSMNEGRYLKQVKDALAGFDPDIVGVSAGFDTYIEDWRGLFRIEYYWWIREAIRDVAKERCKGRRFVVLEGGYHPYLRWCIKSFINGFKTRRK